METINEKTPAGTDGPSKVADPNALKLNPPEIITVDTTKNADENKDAVVPKSEGPNDPSFRQERTPKHANKTMSSRREGMKSSEKKVGQAEAKVSEDSGEKPGAPPQVMGQTHPNQHGAYSRGGESRPPQSQGFDGGPRRHGPPTVGGNNGAFSPHDPQFRDSESSNHPRYYNNAGQPPTVSPGGPAGREGDGFRAGAYYVRGDPQRDYRNGPGGSGYNGLPYRLDDRGPPPQPQGYPRDHRFDQGTYGRPPHFPGPPHPNHPLAFNRGQPGVSYPDRPPSGYRGQFIQGRPPAYPPQHGPTGSSSGAEYQNRPMSREKGQEQVYRPDPSAAGGFTRAVSSSFDKSIKSRTSNEDPKSHEGHSATGPGQKGDASYGDHRVPQGDGGSDVPSDDDSWRQLNQVASVDEDAIRERLKEKEEAKSSRKTAAKQGKDERTDDRPGSNNSSLTNSPTEHTQVDAGRSNAGGKHQPAVPTPSKLTSLDSLSSVASTQEPMDTEGSKEGNSRAGAAPSPGSSHASIDLMKCSSGSSGLLQGFPHQRGGSDGSFYRIDLKRSREERDPDPNKPAPVEEVRKGPSGASDADQHGSQEHSTKRSRHDDGEKTQDSGKKDSKQTAAKDKASPLSIACTPPLSPGGENKSQQEKRPRSQSDPHRQAYGSASPGLHTGSFYDAAPSYTYSIESIHSRTGSFAPLSRPSSSSSSTIPPVGLSHSEGAHREGVTQLPSWDLHQDSFGGGSIGGNNGPLTSAFSFNDYQPLGNSDSNIGFSASHDRERLNDGTDHRNQLPPRQAHSAPPHGRSDGRPPPVAESRNQSFEGGHYHGSFDRTHSMDVGYSGEGPRPGGGQAYGENYKVSQYGGQFPPHAPSWGTTTSTGSHHGPNFRGGHGNYSQYHAHQRPPMPPSPHSRHQAHAYQGVMMRNFSEDSAMRTSPPPGPQSVHLGLNGPLRGGNMNMPSSFQAPPEFAAPQNPHLSRRPPPAVFIMSSPQGGGQAHANADPGLVTKRTAGSGIYGWSKDDDARLTEIMKKYKNPRDWEPIAKEHGRGKTAKECHERWIRYLKPGVRKGQWQDHEDAIVVEAVTTSTEQPFTRWSDLAQRLPGRVGKQIRDRWVNHLNPNINHLPFSKEEDLLLWDGHKKLGKRWVEISTKFFNGTRSENHIKNRWYSATFKKMIANEFGPDAYSGGKKSEGKSKSKKQKSMATIQV